MQFLRVHELTPEELNTVSSLHYQELNESFLNKIGPKFLKITYQGLISNPNNVFMVVKDNNKLIGYLVATTDGKLFSKHFLKANFFSLFKELLIASLKKPTVGIRLIQWIFSNPLTSKKPELQFFAIKSTYQGKGLGTTLINKLNKEFQSLNIKHYLVGTKAANKGSNNFYQKNQFKFVFETKIFGDRFNYYKSPK